MSKPQRAQGASSKKAGVSPISSSKDRGAQVLEKISRTIQNHGLIAAGDLVLVAFSGGPDSTVLLHALAQLRPRLRFRLRAGHVNHGIRGAEAAADERAAAAFARKLRIPFHRHRVDVPAYAKSQGISLETAARQLRYQWLESAATRFGANRIATGHTSDDLAETVLLNLLRGAGPRGLAGIPPIRGRVIRPLLGLTRAEVESYCEANSLGYRRDESNADTAFARNRLRHEVIPLLQEVQPSVVGNLSRTAEIMRAEDDFMSEQADNALRAVASQRPGEVGILLSLFAALHPALRRRVLRAAVGKIKGDEADLPLERIDALMEVALSGETGSVIELPGGLCGERTYGELVISPALAPKPSSDREWVLPVPSKLVIRELGLQFETKRSRAKTPPPNPMEALVDASKTALPLVVRTRRRGDRFRPAGMRGTVKLQDFFVNAKVPREQRDRVPLVLSGEDIVWVVGFRLSEKFRVSGKTKRSIRIRASRLNS